MSNNVYDFEVYGFTKKQKAIYLENEVLFLRIKKIIINQGP